MPDKIAWDSICQKGLADDTTDHSFQCTLAEELFDLSADSFETSNLAYLSEYTEINAFLRQKIEDLVTHTVDLGYMSLPK